MRYNKGLCWSVFVLVVLGHFFCHTKRVVLNAHASVNTVCGFDIFIRNSLETGYYFWSDVVCATFIFHIRCIKLDDSSSWWLYIFFMDAHDSPARQQISMYLSINHLYIKCVCVSFVVMLLLWMCWIFVLVAIVDFPFFRNFFYCLVSLWYAKKRQ